ncbi:unnamed protein product [Staurois parvus]|uniref:Uncharacterized protein n=1 Tax=Staurois parvus TaxID=386267 RepID=A0ABN9H0S0_9NEOB|nr:unnamed protein product [Staurois parvus]
MAECGDGDSSNGRAVQGPMTDSGPGSSSMRRRYIGAYGRLGAWQQLWEARNLPAPYVKKFYTPAVCET